MLTIRFDLPDSAGGLVALESEVARRAQHVAADSAIAVIYADPGEQPPPTRWRLLVARLGVGLAVVGVHLSDALFVADGQWWSYLCVDQDCCPAEGSSVADAAGCAAAAEAVWHGMALAGSREELALSFAQVSPERVLETVAVLGEVEPRVRANFSQWRDVAEAEFIALIASAESEPAIRLAPPVTAGTLLALADFRVRDPIMWFLANQATLPELRAAQQVLLDLVAAAPRDLLPPAATLLAIVCWQLGNGTQAHLALARIARAVPEYALATLVGRALDAGMPPSEWVQMMRGLDIAGCRTGVSSRPRQVAQAPPAA